MANLLSSGLEKVSLNKRYIFWFWLLNLTLAEFGTAGFRRAAHAILDRTLYAERLVKGFDLGVFRELLSKPEFGTLNSMTYPSLYFGFVFFVATALFLPGIFTGYASTYGLPREEFFRACGRNLWRFIRLIIIAGIIMGIITGLLFSANDAISKKADESTNEKLSFELQMAGLAVIFLVMTTLRIWFDLAEVDAVLNDQHAVRKSIAAAFHHTFRSLARLLTSYVVVTIFAALVLVAGLWLWMKLVAPENVFGAFAIGQVTLLLLLIPRFWQRGIAVSYWQQWMLAPLAPTTVVESSPVPISSAPELPAGDELPAGAPAIDSLQS
jgi:hypothetical protein